MLATCRNDALRDPLRALELARDAAGGEAQQRDPDVLDTLAAAQAAAGDFDAAENTIAVALDRAREGGHPAGLGAPPRGSQSAGAHPGAFGGF